MLRQQAPREDKPGVIYVKPGLSRQEGTCILPLLLGEKPRLDDENLGYRYLFLGRHMRVTVVTGFAGVLENETAELHHCLSEKMGIVENRCMTELQRVDCNSSRLW